MKENLNQIGMVQLGVWLLGEFGEMLVNGAATDPEGNPILVEEEEIGDLLERILEDHSRKGERSDTIICWVLTALSKLTIRLKSIQERSRQLIKKFSDHMNVEIQQRACEYLQLLDKKWDDERHGIFEPIPIKSDLESKGRLYDVHDDRPDFEEGDGDEDPLPKPVKTIKKEEKQSPSTVPQTTGNMIDLDDLLGGFSGNQAPTQTQNQPVTS